MSRNISYRFLLFGIVALIANYFWGCSEKKEEQEPTLPAVVTDSVYNITYTTAEMHGTIKSEGFPSISQCGFCWNTSPSPTISNNKTNYGNTEGAFRDNIQNLEEGTKYYVRTYATNDVGTAYGNEIEFETGLSCQTMVMRRPGYQVWAGNTAYFQRNNHYDYFYSIDKYDYKLIGEATTTQTFDTGSYKYYVIVSKYWNCFDAIKFKDGSYYNHGQGYTLYSGLVTGFSNILGAPDNVYGQFGSKGTCPPEGKATYNAYLTDDAMISSRGGGLTVYVGSGCQ